MPLKTVTDQETNGEERREKERQHCSFSLSFPLSLSLSHTHTLPTCYVVGLDAAGKTTILYKLKLGEIVTTIPTIGTSSSSSAIPCVVVSTMGSVFFHNCEWTPLPSQPVSPPRVPITVVLLVAQRLQRGDGRVQEHQLHRVGRGRPG